MADGTVSKVDVQATGSGSGNGTVGRPSAPNGQPGPGETQTGGLVPALKQAVADVVNGFGARGGLMLLISQDGRVYVVGGAGDNQSGEIIKAIKTTLDPIIIEAT